MNNNATRPNATRPNALAPLASIASNPHQSALAASLAYAPGTMLFLMGPGDNARRIAYITNFFRFRDPSAITSLRFVPVNLPNPRAQFFVLKKGAKEKHILTPNYADTIRSYLGAHMQTASVIIVHDFSVLAAILDATGSDPGTRQTLQTWRGSLYRVPSLFANPRHPAGIPILILDDVSKCYVTFDRSASAAPSASKNERGSRIESDHLAQFYLAKVHRFWLGASHPHGIRHAPPFNYTLLSGPHLRQSNVFEADSIHHNIREFLEWLPKQRYLAVDHETANLASACLGVAGVESLSPSGLASMRCWTIPFMHPSHANARGQALTYDTYLSLMRAVLSSPAQRIYANGSYDAHYELKARAHTDSASLPHDVIHLWHSWFPQLPKSLAAIASCILDNYTFWKDDIKGDSSEREAQSEDLSIPITERSIQTYWRYCAMDCWHTMNAWFQLLALQPPDWIITNYQREMSLQYGPMLLASYCGMPLNSTQLASVTDAAADSSESALADLRLASGGIIQTGKDSEITDWLYGVLRPTLPKSFNGKPSMNAKQLMLIYDQHPIYRAAGRLIKAFKEPHKTDISFSALRYPTYPAPTGPRFQYSYSIAGTYTGRLSGKSGAFWYGTNPQNIPPAVRAALTAEPGCVLIDIDYSQADLYHFAVACGDDNMIRNVFDERDTHAVHVETILKIPYADTVRGKKAGDPAVVHPITGTRQIIKKISHGGNYGMTPQSVYVNAGKEALSYAASQLGYDPGGWTIERYYALIEELLAPYFNAYPGQMIFREELVKECVANQGVMTCFGGLTTYFHEWSKPKEHRALMRKLLAFYGQGGTAGMINIAIHRMYYGDESLSLPPLLAPSPRAALPGLRIALQTHDSITYQCPISLLATHNVIPTILTYMEKSCKFNNIEYIVPCEVQIGSTWDKKIPGIANNPTQARTILTALGDILEPSYTKKKGS